MRCVDFTRKTHSVGFLFGISTLLAQMQMRINVTRNHIAITKNIRFGPVALTGTAAPLSRVKAGVFSRSLARAACSWVCNAV